jgi:WD40 repeat protein
LTWQQVGLTWKGHTRKINAIAIHPDGILVASSSDDNHVRLWRLSDQQTIAIFQHPYNVRDVTFSVDGRHILSCGDSNKISEWAVPKDAKFKGGFPFFDLITQFEHPSCRYWLSRQPATLV